MNALLIRLGLEWLKPFLTALLLPPCPFLLLGFVGLVLVRRRRRLGGALLASSLSLVGLSGCVGMANFLEPLLLDIPPPLDALHMGRLREATDGSVAIIVLGAGVEEWAPEYAHSSLQFRSLERLRYGIWLGRRTGWPVGFSGGIGWGQPAGTAREATVAQAIATQEFERPLRWVESRSRDTRENALFTVDMLRPVGVEHIVLVTHAAHMPRAVRNFATAAGARIEIEPAPIGLAASGDWPLLRWIPTGEGLVQVRTVMREWLGMLSGA